MNIPIALLILSAGGFLLGWFNGMNKIPLTPKNFFLWGLGIILITTGSILFGMLI